MSAVGGENVTTTVEGRERYPVSVRYQRDLRSDIDKLQRVLIPAMNGQVQVPLSPSQPLQRPPPPRQLPPRQPQQEQQLQAQPLRRQPQQPRQPQ